MTKPNLLSGVQPSAASLHLGNYLGALTQWVAMQEQFNAYYVIVDLHAITVPQDPKVLRENTRRTAAQYIAAGLDPNKSSLFVQSHVPAHAQLGELLALSLTQRCFDAIPSRKIARVLRRCGASWVTVAPGETVATLEHGECGRLYFVVEGGADRRPAAAPSFEGRRVTVALCDAMFERDPAKRDPW